MGRPQRRSVTSLRDSDQSFGDEDKAGQSYEAYASTSMYPLLQSEEDALMDIQTSDDIFSVDGSNADAAQVDTSWHENLPSLANDKGGPSTPPSYIQPDLLKVLNQ